MDSNNLESNASCVGKPESSAHVAATKSDSDTDTAHDEETPTANAGADPGAKNNRNNRSHSYSSKRIGSIFQRQLERDGATNAHLVRIGEKYLVEGVKAFNNFDKEISDVDAALRLLASTMQLLGSSVGVLHAIYQLRKSLLRLKFHVRENAVFLYEDYVVPNEKRYVREIRPDMKANGQVNAPRPPPKSRAAFDIYKEKTEQKPYKNINGSMGQVGDNLEMFVNRINEISGFHDELVNQTFNAFAGELKYRVNAFDRLKYYPSRAFKGHINMLVIVFGQHLGGMLEALESFQKNSLPIIQRSQERQGIGLQGLSAVSTFFSGITAATIQYQIDDTPTPLQSALNGLWITSLSCSIASAVSAQVVYFWRTSRFSSPSKYTPGVIAQVLQYMPIIYLCLSVSAFMVGLSVFTFSSDQNIVISVLIAAFTGILTFELVIFGVWITLERMAFTWTGGRHWFLQVHIARLLPIIWRYTTSRMRARAKRAVSSSYGGSVQELSDAAEKGTTQPAHQPSLVPVLINNRRTSKADLKRDRILQIIWQYQRWQKITNFLNQYPAIPQRQNSTFTARTDEPAYIDKIELLTAIPHHSGLLKHLAFSPDQKLLATRGWDGTAIVSNVDQTMSSKFMLKHVKNTQSAQLQAREKQLFGKPITEETCVREVAWSPDGRMLATRTRRTVRVWSMEDGSLLNTLPANDGHTVESVAWSWKVQVVKDPTDEGEKRHQSENQKPKTKIVEGSQTLVVMGYINGTNEAVESTYVVHYTCSKFQGSQPVWTHNKEALIEDKIVTSMAIVNDSSIPHTDSSGNLVTNKSIPTTNEAQAKSSSVPIVNDYMLIGVGLDTKGKFNVEPEKFLFLFDFVSGEIIGLSPLTGEVRGISVTVPQKNIALALVIYKGQGAYPQLWRIKVAPRNISEPDKVAKIRYRDFSCVQFLLEKPTAVQAYFAKATSAFSGCGCFGGPDDIYSTVLSEGEVFIWNRETALLLFTIKPANDEHLKFFTCNKPASPEFKCISGAMDGMLSVWATGNAERAAVTYDSPLVSEPQRTFSSPRPLSPEFETKGYLG